MKRLVLICALCAAALALAACGGKGDGAAQKAAESAPQAAVSAAQTQPPADEAPAAAEAPVAPEAVPAGEDRPVDLDLTKISGTVVYSQVYDMMMAPENYLGQRVRMRGSFSYFQDPDTLQEYFATVIADATACCAQGIEFVWKGSHAYPGDYPPLETEITVTGTFDTYYEGDYMYVRLIDADVEW